MNLSPHSKYRDIAWRLWAIFPKLDRDAYIGNEFARRNAELHHACCTHLVDDLQALSEEIVNVLIDGFEVEMRIILAVILGDHLEQEKQTLSRSGCIYCRCPLEKMDDTTHVHELITVQDQQRRMQDICEECLDGEGNFKPGKKSAFQEAEQKLGFRILENAWWKVSDILLYTNRHAL